MIVATATLLVVSACSVGPPRPAQCIARWNHPANRESQEMIAEIGHPRAYVAGWPTKAGDHCSATFFTHPGGPWVMFVLWLDAPEPRRNSQETSQVHGTGEASSVPRRHSAERGGGGGRNAQRTLDAPAPRGSAARSIVQLGLRIACPRTATTCGYRPLGDGWGGTFSVGRYGTASRDRGQLNSARRDRDDLELPVRGGRRG